LRKDCARRVLVLAAVAVVAFAGAASAQMAVEELVETRRASL
jgi:hypothetical protein